MTDGAKERLDVYHFGTLKWQPSANVVYQTAEANLVAWRERPVIRNLRAKAKNDGACARHQGSIRGVAFLPAHLQSARTVSDVIRAAIKGISDGRKSSDTNTLYMYQSGSTLYDALLLAETAERNAETASSNN